jgi:tetratricopeptide (TPR) repeat protein
MKHTMNDSKPLSLLFMTCSPGSNIYQIDHHHEEETIFKMTEDFAIHIQVEDSGMLAGLKKRLDHHHYDVIHLSGFGDINAQGIPVFMMEDEVGEAVPVSPNDLYEDALINNPPQLLFLSFSTTNREESQQAVHEFARIMKKKHTIPFVLSWGHPVGETGVGKGEGLFYKELARGKSIQHAAWRIRNQFKDEDRCSWTHLKLFTNAKTPTSIVYPGQQAGVNQKQVLLKNNRIHLQEQGFVGRRKSLQLSTKTLRQRDLKNGILILGNPGLGKSNLAVKICERFKDHTLILHKGKMDEFSLISALRDSFKPFQDKNGLNILKSGEPFPEQLGDICVQCFKDNKYLLLLDDFEANLEMPESSSMTFRLTPEAAEIMQVLLKYLYFYGSQTPLIITSRYRFSLQDDAYDLIEERLETLWLTSFDQLELRKLAQLLVPMNHQDRRHAIKQLMALGCRNPKLMEEIVNLSQKDADTKRETFISNSGLRVLIDDQFMEDNVLLLLQSISIFRCPVNEEGIECMAECVSIPNWNALLSKVIGFGLVEYNPIYNTYMLSPLLKEDLLPDNPEFLEPLHKEAFFYFRNLSRENTNILDYAEEMIFHALHCGRLEEVSKYGAELVRQLRDDWFQLVDATEKGVWILSQLLKQKELSSQHDANLLNETALSLKNLGNYQQAVNYYHMAYTIDKQLFGETNLETIRDLTNLGAVYLEIEDYPKARKIFESILPHVEQKSGKKSLPYVTVLNNLGTALSHLGLYDESFQKHLEALGILETISYPTEREKAKTLNNLGFSRQKSGALDEALKYFRQALDIDKTLHELPHPDMAIDMKNIKFILAEMGKTSKAND